MPCEVGKGLKRAGVPQFCLSGGDQASRSAQGSDSLSLLSLQPHSLIANVIAGSSVLGFHMGRDGQASRHLSEVASALRSFSPLQSAQQPSGGFQTAGRDGEGTQPRGSSAMTASGADARTMSSGSSAWEGQLQSMILSEYASTEMSLHALYMHELHKQHAQLEPERHTWHRRESDESGESTHEELDAQRGAPVPLPRSASYPFSSRQPAEETATLQTGFQRRYGGITDPGTVHRAPSHFSRLPLGGWAEDGQSARHPEPVPEESSEDELPPQIHKV